MPNKSLEQQSILAKSKRASVCRRLDRSMQMGPGGNGAHRFTRVFSRLERRQPPESGVQHKTVAESLMTADGLQPLV